MGRTRKKIAEHEGPPEVREELPLEKKTHGVVDHDDKAGRGQETNNEKKPGHPLKMRACYL